ncbi:MAG: peptidase U32 family protein [candidate division NC10 bacterium]|nr:peptidase U32 family protein [candidate division NC10 bacterium]
MNPERFELNTGVSNLKDLMASDLSPYDAIYLGNPYCRDYEANFLEQPEDLRAGIRHCRQAERKVYLTTYAAPRNYFLPQIRRAIAVAAEEGVDAVEAHNLGVARVLHTEFSGLAIHVGGFANVYTDTGAAVLRDYGAARVTPNYELSLEEIEAMAGSTGLALEILVHGKMPLGISDYCFLLEYEKAWGMKCPDLCQQDLFLRQGEWAMKSVGKGVLSGRDVCMLEHLPRLVAAGLRDFRVEAISEDPMYRREIGRVYREALERACNGGYQVEEQWWARIQAHAKVGLCNGFYFGQSGQLYIGSRPSAVGRQLQILD